MKSRIYERKMKELIDGLKMLLEKYEKLSYYLNDPNDDFDNGKRFAYRAVYSDIEKKKKKYERAADITVYNDGSPDKTAGEVIEKYEDTCNKRG